MSANFFKKSERTNERVLNTLINALTYFLNTLINAQTSINALAYFFDDFNKRTGTVF